MHDCTVAVHSLVSIETWIAMCTAYIHGTYIVLIKEKDKKTRVKYYVFMVLVWMSLSLTNCTQNARRVALRSRLVTCFLHQRREHDVGRICCHINVNTIFVEKARGLQVG